MQEASVPRKKDEIALGEMHTVAGLKQLARSVPPHQVTEQLTCNSCRVKDRE